MPRPPSKKHLGYIKKAGVFAAKDAQKAGVSKTTLYRLLASGKLRQAGRGLFLDAKASIDPSEYDFIAACRKFGEKSVIGGLTALSHYQLIEEVPMQIWVLVPYEKKTQQRRYRLIRTNTASNVGVTIHKHGYRMTTVERTLLEALKYASKIGLESALKATRTALKNRQTTLKKIEQTSRELKMKDLLMRYWEAIIV